MNVKQPCGKAHAHCHLCAPHLYKGGGRIGGSGNKGILNTDDVGPCVPGRSHHWRIEGSMGTCLYCSKTRTFKPRVAEAHPFVACDALREQFE